MGAGANDVPDRATAAIDVRLVKETRGQDLIQKIRAHIQTQGYELVGADPDEQMRRLFPRLARMQVSETAIEAFSNAAVRSSRALADERARTAAFAAPPVRLRTLGGTVPIAAFIEALGFPAVVLPTVNFDNNQHEENENLRLGQFFQAIELIAIVIRG